MNIRIRSFLFLCSSAALMFGQTGPSLQLSSAAATPGATVSLQLSLTPASTVQPVALQWDLSVPPNVVATNVTVDAAATSAGKSLTCAGFRCIVWGMNATTISSGTVAMVNVTLSATASGLAVVRLTNLVGVAVDDTTVPISAGSGTITILAPLSISVSPATISLSAGQSTQFVANVTGGSGNTAVTWSLNPNLGAISSGGVYTAPAAISSQQTVTVTATLGTLSASSTVTVPAATLRTMFQLAGAPAELAGTTNGSTVTPAVGPSGVLTVKGSGSVNFASMNSGGGMYFLNCCANVNNAYYQFSGVQVGSIFDTNQGEIDLDITSRQSWSQRQTSAFRTAFDVQDVIGQHLFRFFIINFFGRLAFVYGLGSGTVDYYYVPVGQEDAVFGTGVTVPVRLLWSSGKRYLYLNGVLKNTTNYTAVAPVWLGNSTFTLGAQQYLTYGGYNSDDDMLGEISVRRP